MDKCCEDAVWFKTKYPNACVIVDNHHMITRYNDNSNGTDKARHALFMKEMSKTTIGEYGTPMQVGQTIYEDLSTFSKISVEHNLNFMHP